MPRMTWSLHRKLLVAFICVGIIPLTILSAVTLQRAESALRAQAFDHMQSVRDARKSQVAQYLDTIEDQVRIMSADPSVGAAMARFDRAWTEAVGTGASSEAREAVQSYYRQEFAAEYKQQNRGDQPPLLDMLAALDPATIAMQERYITSNPHPLGAKNDLVSTRDGSRYDALHGEHHPVFRDFLDTYGYYDIFLVSSATGRIVYSVFKELDFGTSLIDGPYAATGIGQAFQAALGADSPDAVVFEDFATYLPSYRAPAGFVASPIEVDGQRTGVLIYQFPIDNLNAIMTARSGMGESGEAYLVGKDRLMRSDSFLDPEHRSVVASFRNPEDGTIDTEATRAALAGTSGEAVIRDYNGNPVLSAYTPLEKDGLQWALMAEIDTAEAFAAIQQLKWLAGVLLCLALAAIVTVALLLTRKIVRPIGEVTDVLTILAQGQGDLTVRLPVLTTDEVGELARRFNEFLEKLHHMIKDVTAGITTLASSATELAAVAQQVSAGVVETSAKSETVAAAAEQMSVSMLGVADAMGRSNTNSTAVASAANEMIATINAIASNSAQAHTISSQAVARTEAANREMAQLGASAVAIGQVTEMIKAISEQTNLLALNATIEAARAGSAGKGFAVVAGEIKDLARQTAEATVGITAQVESIQASTTTTETAITDVKDIIANVNDLVAAIASAVEEQSAVTQEIAGNISQISGGIVSITDSVDQSSTAAAEITREIARVNEATQEVADSITQVATSSADLSQLSEQLDALVGRFET